MNTQSGFRDSSSRKTQETRTKPGGSKIRANSGKIKGIRYTLTLEVSPYRFLFYSSSSSAHLLQLVTVTKMFGKPQRLVFDRVFHPGLKQEKGPISLAGACGLQQTRGLARKNGTTLGTERTDATLWLCERCCARHQASHPSILCEQVRRNLA